MLDDILRKVMAVDGDIGAWQQALSTLRRCTRQLKNVKKWHSQNACFWHYKCCFFASFISANLFCIL